jgi:hypothetical protein
LPAYEHEQQVKRLAEHFKKPLTYYTQIAINTELLKKQQHTKKNLQLMNEGSEPARSAFEKRKVEDFANYEEAYHQLIVDIVFAAGKKYKSCA